MSEWTTNPAVVAGVAVAVVVVAATAYVLTSASKKKTLLEAKDNEWVELLLTKKTELSPNTAIYHLALPDKEMSLGLPIGQHIQVTANIDGKDITRSYTPISSNDDLGVLDLLIKSYPTGNLSRWFTTLKVGDKVKIRGPKGRFKYVPNMVKTFAMIAGGSGITPMLQIAKAILKNPDDKTKVNLIFANVNPSDILMKSELDRLAKSDPRFSVYYVLNTPEAGWTGGVGFVTKDMIAEYGAKPSKDGSTKVLLCGPPPMIQAMQKHCEELGFAKAQAVSKVEDDIFKF